MRAILPVLSLGLRNQDILKPYHLAAHWSCRMETVVSACAVCLLACNNTSSYGHVNVPSVSPAFEFWTGHLLVKLLPML